MYVCICGILDNYKTHAVQCMIIEVHADIVMECRGIYIRMKLGGSGGMSPQGKFEFLGEIMLHLRPF